MSRSVKDRESFLEEVASDLDYFARDTVETQTSS